MNFQNISSHALNRILSVIQSRKWLNIRKCSLLYSSFGQLVSHWGLIFHNCSTNWRVHTVELTWVCSKQWSSQNCTWTLLFLQFCLSKHFLIAHCTSPEFLLSHSSGFLRNLISVYWSEFIVHHWIVGQVISKLVVFGNKNNS